MLPPLPSFSRTILTLRLTGSALLAVATRLDLDELRHLPTVLAHLDEAAAVGRAAGDPVGTAVRAPGEIARIGLGGVRATPRVVAGPPRLVVATPLRIVQRPQVTTRDRVLAAPGYVVAVPGRVVGAVLRRR